MMCSMLGGGVPAPTKCRNLEMAETVELAENETQCGTIFQWTKIKPTMKFTPLPLVNATASSRSPLLSISLSTM